MPTSFPRFGLLVIAWLTLFSVVLPDVSRDVRAQERRAGAASAAETSVVETTAQGARARWEALSAEDKVLVQKRFDRLQQLDREEREELAQRSERWRAQEQLVLLRLSVKDRERLMLNPPEKQKQLIEEMVRAQKRDEGHRIEAKLPKKTRDWLATAPPEQRRERLQQFKEETRKKLSALAVEELVRALGMGENEVERLESLPVEERMTHVLRLRKRLTTLQLTKGGLPPGFSPEQWAALENLPPEQYFGEILRLRHEGELREMPPVSDAERRHEKVRRAPEVELSRNLWRALNNSPRELLELAHLSEVERSAEIDARRRSRVMLVLRMAGTLSEQQMSALDELTDKDLFDRARAVANGWKSPDWSEANSSESKD